MGKRDIQFEELIIDRRLKQLQQNASSYGVAVDIVAYGVDSDIDDGGYYIVAGLEQFPDLSTTGSNPKQLENQIKRNRELFYPKFFVEELTPETLNVAIQNLRIFCENAELLYALFKEYNCPLPHVIRQSEVDCLNIWNKERANQQQTWTFREINERNLEKFFQNEKAMLKGDGYKEFMQYLRSDRYSGDMYEPKKKKKKDYTYYKMKGEQEIPLELLQHTGAEIVEAFLEDKEIQDMKKTLKYTPYVFYSVGPLEKIDHSRINDPEYDPWAGKERYWECRKFYFKKVDEPEVASAWIRIAYEDVNTRNSVQRAIRDNLPEERPVARYIPYRNMDFFLRIAKEQNLQFTFDYSGILLKPTFERIPVMVSRANAGILDAIITTIDLNLLQSHKTNEYNLPHLADTLGVAELLQIGEKGAHELPDFAGKRLPMNTDYVL